MPGKLGLGLGDNLMSTTTPVVIEDYFWDIIIVDTKSSLEPLASGTVVDVHDSWDLDGVDYTPEAVPGDEGYWDTGANIITGFTNGSTHAFSTFGSSGNNITSAIVSSAFAGAASNALTLADGDVVTVKFNYTKTSGNDLRVLFAVNANGAASSVSNIVNISSSGFQSHDFTITATGTAHLQLGTGNSGHSINFSATDISAVSYTHLTLPTSVTV